MQRSRTLVNAHKHSQTLVNAHEHAPQRRCPPPCPSVDQKMLKFAVALLRAPSRPFVDQEMLKFALAVRPIPQIPKIPPNPRSDKIPVPPAEGSLPEKCVCPGHTKDVLAEGDLSVLRGRAGVHCDRGRAGVGAGGPGDSPARRRVFAAGDRRRATGSRHCPARLIRGLGVWRRLTALACGGAREGRGAGEARNCRV